MEAVLRECVRIRESQLPGYQLMGRLGKGAMATVYKAKQLSLDRIVAIKVLPKKMSDNPDAMRNSTMACASPDSS